MLLGKSSSGKRKAKDHSLNCSGKHRRWDQEIKQEGSSGAVHHLSPAVPSSKQQTLVARKPKWGPQRRLISTWPTSSVHPWRVRLKRGAWDKKTTSINLKKELTLSRAKKELSGLNDYCKMQKKALCYAKSNTFGWLCIAWNSSSV